MIESKESLEEDPENEGLLFACNLEGDGSATMLQWDDVNEWKPDDGALWLHFDRNAAEVHHWLRTESGLSEPTISALLAEETRPRVFRGKKGTIAILRGVNLNEGSDVEDMIDIRIWSDGERVITLRSQKVMSLREVLAQLTEEQDGPRSASELYERLISRLVDRMASTVNSFDDKLDEIETSLDISNAAKSRRELSDLRQKAIQLRRYIAPQREALYELLMEPPHWLEEINRINLRETVDRLLRYIESLDTVRERSMVIKDDIANQLAESSNRTLYVLSIISAIFLPLGFLTGLLGINVGGMPGVDNPYAFWVSAAVMVIIVVAQMYIFRKLKWLK